MPSSAAKISVIVPFFNAAATIGRCAGSLFGQTAADCMEFIFVDDASTDGGREELEKTILKYPGIKGRVRIVANERNMGSAYSREAGTSLANGDFMIHCDADDWVDAGLYSHLLGVAESTGADVVCCPFCEEHGDRHKYLHFNHGKVPPLNDMPLDTLHFSLCNKLVSIDLIRRHDLHFFSGVNCWEDLGVMARVFVYARKVVATKEFFYHYRREAGASQTTSDMKRVLSDHLLLADALSEWFASNNLAEMYAPFLNFLKFTAKIKMMRGADRDAKRWRNTYPETNRCIMGYRHVPLHYRLAFFLASHLPLWLVEAICNAAKKSENL